MAVRVSVSPEKTSNAKSGAQVRSSRVQLITKGLGQTTKARLSKPLLIMSLSERIT